MQNNQVNPPTLNKNVFAEISRDEKVKALFGKQEGTPTPSAIPSNTKQHNNGTGKSGMMQKVRSVDNTNAKGDSKTSAIKTSAIEEQDEKKSRSHATQCYELIKEHWEYRCFEFESQEYICIEHEVEHEVEHEQQSYIVRQTCDLNSSTFRKILMMLFLKHMGTALSETGYKGVKETLKAHAMNKREDVFFRIGKAYHNDKEAIVIDCGTALYNCFVITPQGWYVEEKPPCNIIRAKDSQPFFSPSNTPNIDALKKYCVLSDEDFLLLIGFLLSSFNPFASTFAILGLRAQAGSGKSFLTTIIKRLLDNSSAIRKSIPKDEQSVFVSAKHAHLFVMDNISYISTEISDALCRVATGGTFSTRELYTNSEISSVNIARPIILNGIADLGEREDLKSRMVTIDLQEIPEDQRKTESVLMAEFIADAPHIMAGLFELVSQGLRNKAKGMRFDRLPRCADSAEFAAQCLGKEKGEILLEHWRNNQRDEIQDSSETSEFCALLEECVSSNVNLTFTNDPPEWIVSPAELEISMLNQYLKQHPNAKRPRFIPLAKQMKERIRRDAKKLEFRGISVTFPEGGKINGKRVYIIAYKKNNATQI